MFRIVLKIKKKYMRNFHFHINLITEPKIKMSKEITVLK